MQDAMWVCEAGRGDFGIVLGADGEHHAAIGKALEHALPVLERLPHGGGWPECNSIQPVIADHAAP